MSNYPEWSNSIFFLETRQLSEFSNIAPHGGGAHYAVIA